MNAWDVLATGSVRPLRRVEVEHLSAGGAFDDERVELIRGILVSATPVSVRRASCLEQLVRDATVAISGRARVRPRLPFAASDVSLLAPDLAVVPADAPRDVHPERALLVVEVSDSSLRKDRRVKVPIYAEAGVPEVWLVNLEDDVVEVYQDPRGSEYGRKATYGRGETLTVSAFPDVQIAVTTLLG